MQQQKSVKKIVTDSVKAEKVRKKAQREVHKRAVESVENYDASKHNNFDVRKNPLMSGGHGKNFTNKPRFGRPKPKSGG
jgi:hypothetical protein